MIKDVSASGVPVLSKNDLERIADSYTRSFIQYDQKDKPLFSVWKFASCFLGKKVSFEHLSNNSHILGISVFVDGTPIPIYIPETGSIVWKSIPADSILLDRSLAPDKAIQISKSRFTLMHESAHQILHSTYYRRLTQKKSGGPVAFSVLRKEIDEKAIASKVSVHREDVDWIEWQANYLASALLIPKDRLKRFLKDSMLYEDYQHKACCKQDESQAYNFLVYQLAVHFGVSETTMRIRLQTVGFQRLENLYDPKPAIFSSFIAIPKSKKVIWQTKTTKEVLREWEDRYLDPDVEY